MTRMSGHVVGTPRLGDRGAVPQVGEDLLHRQRSVDVLSV